MKKFLSVFLSAGLLLSLCACNNSNKVAVSPVATVESQSPASSPVNSPLNTAEQTPEEIIESAMNVYGWFAMVPLEVDYENVKHVDDNDWYKVKDENYNTHDKLDSYLRMFFSSDIVNELWNYNVYKDIDGELYGLDGGRGTNIFIENVKYDVNSISGNKIVYTATVTYSKDSGEVENPKIFEFVREKVNGNWVFTSFPFFW